MTVAAASSTMPAMTPDQIDSYVAAAAAALALPLATEHRPGVLRYFALAAEMAALVDGLPLTLADEPAEAFRPIEPTADGSGR